MSKPILRSPGGQPASQAGVVLVMALIIMGVMAIASTAALKLALSGSQIALGLRTSNLALQAAESGLRWCELQTRLAVRGVVTPVVPRPPQAGALLWETRATFTANAVRVPAAVLNGAGLVNFAVLPDCVSEETVFPEFSADVLKGRVFVITARGFSPDYNRAAGGDTSGGEVWLQSQLYLP